MELALNVLRDSWRPRESHQLTSELVCIDGYLAKALVDQMMFERVLSVDASPSVVGVIPLSGDTAVVYSLF